MIPDMSDALDEWSLPYLVKTVEERTIDFESFDFVTGRTINAVVQVAQKNKLNTDQIDWSLRYLQIHTANQLENGELIEFQGEDYKIIDNGDYQLYGFTEAVAEQTKKEVIKVTTPRAFSPGFSSGFS